ncbi:MAG: alpha/beta hydrolase [Isosphaeraceae bacterium]
MTMSDRRSMQEPTEPAGDDGSLRPSCLVLHGLGGGRYELEPVIAGLEAEGLRVSAPVLPGHDGPGPVMPSSSWRDWTAAVESSFDELAAGGGPVIVVGFSTGGTLALELASRRPVARLVLLAPFLAIRHSGLIPIRSSTILGLLSRFKPDLPRRAPAVKDRDMRRLAADSDRFRTFNLGAAMSALELIEEVKPLIPRITVPTLIIQGKHDSVVEPGWASELYRLLGSTRKSLVVMPRSDHLVALDRDREQVIALTRDFVLGRGDPFAGPETH